MKKFFSYKTHFILLVIVASAVSSTAMLMKSNASQEQSRLALIRGETIQKMNPFKRLVSYKLDELKSGLLNYALNRKNPRQDTASIFGTFNSVALMQATGREQTPKWIESDPKEMIWTNEYQATALKSLPFQKIDGGGSGFAWFKYQEGSAKPLYFTVFEIEAHRKDQNKKAYLVGMSAKNPLASITDDYRGTNGKIYLLNDKAFVAAHTTKVLDGSSFAADPVYMDMKASKRAMSSGSFVDLSGESVFAYYEKIEHSNLFAVVTSPKTNLKILSAGQWQAGAPFIVGMLGFFAFVAYMFTQRLGGPASQVAATRATSEFIESEQEYDTPNDESAESEFESLERKKREAKNLRNELMKKGLASINPFVLVPPTAPPPTAPPPAAHLVAAPVTKAENGEKNFEFLKMMSKGLTKLFSERISGMIAEASLIVAKSKDDEITSHAKIIQTESRKTRDLLRELEQFDPSRPLELDTIDLAQVCEFALAKLQDEFDLEGIEIEKELDPKLKVRASIEKLQASIEKVLLNSIEALKGRSEKKITMRVFNLGQKIELSITDTGIGMPKETQEKIFLPFYRDFSNTDGNGLGLSYVQGAIEAMKGEVKVQSSPGGGTEMKFLFPIVEVPVATALSNARNYEALKNPKLNLDFIGDLDDDSTEAAAADKSYFELEESDLDQEFDEHLKKLSDKMIQKKAKIEAATPEFNVLTDFEDDDEDVDNFKVVIREPRSKPLS